MREEVKMFFLFSSASKQDHRVKMVATRGKKRHWGQTLQSSSKSPHFPLLLLKSDGCLIFPTKKLWTPNPPHPKMMDPNLPPHDGSRRIQRRCESGTNVSQLRGCGDPSVKMRNNYAIITPQTSHQMHPFAHKMRNLGVGRKRKMKTTGKKDMRGNRNTGIAKVGEDPSVIQNN